MGVRQPLQALRGVSVRLGRRRDPIPDDGGRVCNAPFTSMYLDQRGWVRACCMNITSTLGNVTEQPLSEIWRGAGADRLKRAMERGDLTLGCDVCKWQVDEGRAHLAYLKWYRDLPVTEPDPEWPLQLELSVSNTCNLQCVMCNGEWSSSIRSQREGLEPLPKVYDDAFFEDLRQFLPHLRRIKILGGEPFLASETLRVLEMLVEMGLTPECSVTTNGTQWTPRVERILEMLPIDLAVSIDAATAETYESIRVGSSWELVQANLDRFADYAKRKGTAVTLTFCLMRSNWHELLAFCQMADARGMGSTVNTVTMPVAESLYSLSAEELAVVVEGMEDQDRREGATLTLGAATWNGELERLRGHLRDRTEGRSVVGVDKRALQTVASPAFDRSEEQYRAEHRDEILAAGAGMRERHLPPGGWRLRVDVDGVLVSIDPDGDVLGLKRSSLIGKDMEELSSLMIDTYGVPLHSHTLEEMGLARAMETAHPRGRTIRVVLVPDIEADGTVTGTDIDVNWLDPQG